MSIFERLRSLDECDEPRSLRFASTGLPLWPFVRWTAVSAATETALGLQAPFSEAAARSLRQTAELVARSQLRGPLSVRRPFDIVVVSSSVGTVLEREGRWFDRINDYFAVENPEQTLVLDRAVASGYKRPRFPTHVRCYDGFDIRAGVLARLRRPVDADLANIERLLGFLREKSPVPLSTSALERMRAHLVHYAVRLPILRELWARFFDRIKPRVLAVEDGSYGGFAHLLSWARDAGVATAEFQHGVISRSHLAYNVGDALRTDDTFARCLPQYLLLYGEVYTREVRTPSRLEVIGCPHFSETAGASRSSGSNILFVSQGTRTDAMVALALAIAARFPDRRIVFRLHPGELAFPERFASLKSVANIAIDERGDIYERFRSAAVVIGHSSTALVEAAGMGLPVLLLDDAAARAILPADLGTWFRDADELATLVTSPPRKSIEPAQFFAPDWRDRYRRFLDRVTVGAA